MKMVQLETAATDAILSISLSLSLEENYIQPFKLISPFGLSADNNGCKNMAVLHKYHLINIRINIDKV